MQCPRCQAANADSATFCAMCGTRIAEAVPTVAAVVTAGDAANPYRAPAEAVGVAVANNCPPNYLVYSIVTTMCCCIPFGIVSIVYAAQVNGKFEAGDFAGAQDASAKAKMWAWLGFGVGLAVGLLSVLGQAALALGKH